MSVGFFEEIVLTEKRKKKENTSVTSRTDFKTVKISKEQQTELDEKIRRHRHRTFWRVAVILLLVLTVVIGVQLWSALRTYTSFEILSTVERQDNMATKYETFLGNILEYNNDGIV